VGNIDLSGNSVPTLGDLDADGDLDMLIGQLNGSLIFYRNEGTTSAYNFQEESFDDIQVQSNSAPELMDMDGDGDLDLVLGSVNEGLLFYQNVVYQNGCSNFLQFPLDSDTIIPLRSMNTSPSMGQLFDEETLDIIAGVSTGGVYHIQINTLELDVYFLGDLNIDGNWNVLDIITLANCVLADNCTEEQNSCAGDMNGDGHYNVLDIVTLTNCILAGNCSGD
jgi:hypothetical protein